MAYPTLAVPTLQLCVCSTDDPMPVFCALQDKVDMDRAKLTAEFESMRKSTNDSITEAATAKRTQEEAEAKLRNIMDGATVAEKELEVALFNSVHECAQVGR